MREKKDGEKEKTQAIGGRHLVFSRGHSREVVRPGAPYEKEGGCGDPCKSGRERISSIVRLTSLTPAQQREGAFWRWRKKGFLFLKESTRVCVVRSSSFTCN